MGSSLSFLIFFVVGSVADGPSCAFWRTEVDYGLEELVCDVHHVAMVLELEVPAITSIHREPSEEVLLVRGAAEAGTA